MHETFIPATKKRGRGSGKPTPRFAIKRYREPVQSTSYRQATTPLPYKGLIK